MAGGASIDWRFVLTVYRFLPSPPLSASVEAFCFSEGETSLQTKERRLPDGRVALVINLGHEMLRVSHREHADQFQSFHGGVLSGAHSQFSVLDMTTLVTTMYVCFKPGGETNDDRVRILEHFLLARLPWEQASHPAVTFALASFQAGHKQRSISEVTAQLGLNPKRFIKLFEEAVGLTPKVFCRLLRFQEALCRTTRGQPARWADLALDCGYFDQAHFIHDFQAFTGLTPSAYLAQRGEHHNHVPLPD